MTYFTSLSTRDNSGDGDYLNWVNEIVGTTLLPGAPEKIELARRNLALDSAEVDEGSAALAGRGRKRRL